MSGGVLRAEEFVSEAQAQTKETFGFKWSKLDTFEGATKDALGAWLSQKYGRITETIWFKSYGDHPVILDAGCGAALSAGELFAPALDTARYIGVDISTAVDVGRTRFRERGYNAAFIQSDLNSIPLPEASVDIVFSEGVLHHTDNTRAALTAVVRHLKPGGRAMFYVYRKKGPIREFTDDYVRSLMQDMTPEEGWKAMESLTNLGILLGELDVDVEIPEDITLLDIPAGKINLQRLFYWHVAKTFYRPEMNLDEMNHLNFDWYAPKNANRHTLAEVQGWCADLGIEIETEREEMAGLTIIAKKVA